MKKNIKDYLSSEGKVGIFCKNAEEFDTIARMIRNDHFAIGKYMLSGYDTIYLYSTGCGWNTRQHGIENGRTIYNASDFLEDTENDQPLFKNLYLLTKIIHILCKVFKIKKNDETDKKL